MDLKKAMLARHSVRQYEPIPLTDSQIGALQAEIKAINEEAGLHFQLVTDEPKAFDCFMAHYGKFSGVTNYLALVGPKSADLEEKCGYYGERLVLLAQTLGLNSCWVALTYKKVPGAFSVGKGEKLTVLICLGTGKTQGAAHKSKAVSDVSQYEGEMPDWFRSGVEAALLAPTAINQQRFFFAGFGNAVSATDQKSVCSKIDLGIVKYHFELGAGKDSFIWAKQEAQGSGHRIPVFSQGTLCSASRMMQKAYAAISRKKVMQKQGGPCAAFPLLTTSAQRVILDSSLSQQVISCKFKDVSK